jgi:hypothetical protein
MTLLLSLKKHLRAVAVCGCALLSFPSAFAQEDSYRAPALENSASWSLVLIPDIQNYVKWSRNQPILELMMAWIEENIDPLNIRMVVCVGDLVQSNEKIINDYDGNQTSTQQWQAASRAFERLDGKVPYVAAAGNHEYSIDPQGNRSSRYSEFFTSERNHLNQKILVQNNRNEQGQPTLENSAYELKNLHGQDYLFLTVEYAPRDSIVEWAKEIAALDQYKQHRIVLITHAYLTPKDQLWSRSPVTWLYWEPYNLNNQIKRSKGVPLPKANNGRQIWEKLVQPASNIEMVFCGHISGEGYRRDVNVAGKAVHEVLFDTQDLGGGHRSGNGGDGWLRILEFFPDNKTVKLKTFSPLFAASPTTQQFAWKQDERNEFVMEFN